MKRLIIILSTICLGCQTTSEYTESGKNVEIFVAQPKEIASKYGKAEPATDNINTIDLFVFDSANKLEKRERFSTDIYQPKTVILTSVGEKKIYAIANADTNINLENLPKNDVITPSDIESLEIMHKNIHLNLPYVAKTIKTIALLTPSKIELKFKKVHAKVEVINQTPEQITISKIETYNLPNKAYIFKDETPSNVEYNQISNEATFYTFATDTPINIEITTEDKKIAREIAKLETSKTTTLNIAKLDNGNVDFFINDDWQGYQTVGTHTMGDISVVSQGASFSQDGTLLTYSNLSSYTLNLVAPNYSILELTLKSSQPWITITKATNPYTISVLKNDLEEERTTILSINKNNVAIKYIVVKQAKKPILYFIQEPIQDNIKQKVANTLDMAGGAKSGVLSVEFSTHETMAPSAIDLIDGITITSENLTAKTLKLNFAQIKAGISNKRTANLKIKRAGGTEVANITINQTPHTLSVADYSPFVATNAPEQSQTVTATGADPKYDWLATSKDVWLTATKSTNSLKLKPTNNTGAARTTNVTLNYDGTTLDKSITQNAGYIFTLSSANATIEKDNLKAYSIAKTYTVTITSNTAVNFNNVAITCSNAAWTIAKQTTTTATTGTFTIKLPAASSTTIEQTADVTIKVDGITVKTMAVTQAKKVSFSITSPYNIVGGESTKPVVNITSSTWDIESQTVATGTSGTLSITTDQTNNRFTINTATALNYNTAKTLNTLTLKNDKSETIATYLVSQAPIDFTIATSTFKDLLAAGETRNTTVATTGSLAWTINTPTYNPINSKGWLTTKNNNNTSLSLTAAKSTLSTARSASVTLNCKGTTSQAISVTQKEFISNEVTINGTTWLKCNEGALLGSLPSLDWDASAGKRYNMFDSETICPSGYILPSSSDYSDLLSSTSIAYLQKVGSVYIRLTDRNVATNILEFPAAGIFAAGSERQKGQCGYYRASDDSSFFFNHEEAKVSDAYDPNEAMSVRCIKK